MTDIRHRTILDVPASELSGRSVLLAVHDQLCAAMAMIELDGIARRLIVCPPDVSPLHIPTLIDDGEVDTIVSDTRLEYSGEAGVLLNVRARSFMSPSKAPEAAPIATEWVLLTSGTTGAPKMVVHSLASLTAAINSTHHQDFDVVWATFYDVRRFGGLQIFLRALLGNGSLVLSSPNESPTNHLLRLAARSVTHLTGTPSHWRRALMSPTAQAIAPRYVRLSGEIADQALMNMLRSFYPKASIAHAFASTEAGVAFEVNDGLEGFPADFLAAAGDVDLKVEDQSLRVRSSRTAWRFLGKHAPALLDSAGFVDTGDIVEVRDGRYYFLGRASGLINVGGLKVYPEEIEAVLNRHPAVRMSCVHARRNPITGSLVVADVVLKENVGSIDSTVPELKDELLRICRDMLPRHKVPALLNFVPTLDVAATGKVARA